VTAVAWGIGHWLLPQPAPRCWRAYRALLEKGAAAGTASFTSSKRYCTRFFRQRDRQTGQLRRQARRLAAFQAAIAGEEMAALYSTLRLSFAFSTAAFTSPLWQILAHSHFLSRENPALPNLPKCNRDDQPNGGCSCDHRYRIVVRQSLPTSQCKREKPAAAQRGAGRIDACRDSTAVSTIRADPCLLLFFMALNKGNASGENRRKSQK
jgi:hypothetical protein